MQQTPFHGDMTGPVTTRPASITVFGILNIVFGAMGVGCSPFALAPLFNQSEDVITQLYQESPFMYACFPDPSACQGMVCPQRCSCSIAWSLMARNVRFKFTF